MWCLMAMAAVVTICWPASALVVASDLAVVNDRTCSSNPFGLIQVCDSASSGYDGQVQVEISYGRSAMPVLVYDGLAVRFGNQSGNRAVCDRALFAKFAEFLAAEGGTAALQPMADAALQTGTIRNVAGYELGGNAGLAGNTYNVNLWALYETQGSQGPFALINALKGEASAAGANQISITGSAVINQDLLNIPPAIANRLGLQFQQINPTTILLQGAVH